MIPVWLCGLLCLGLSIFGTLAPLEKIIDVIESRDPRFINLPIAVATVINAILWTLYGFLSADLFVFISNLVGVFSGVI